MNKRTAAIAALVILIGLLLFFARARKEMVDFSVNYKAGQRLSWGESLYRTEDGHYQFKYPPLAAMLYLPLSLLPLSAAKAIWFFVILAVSVALFFAARKLAPRISPHPAWLTWIPVLVLGRYYLRELQLGQINTLITFILVVMTGLLIRSEKKDSAGAEGSAGVLWALAVALKPYALIFLPYLALKKKFKAIFAGAISLAAAFVLPSLYYGFAGNWSVHREWIRSLSQSTPQLMGSQDNASLMALFTKWTGRPSLAFVLWTVGLLLLIVLVFLFVRRGRTLADPIPLDSGLLLLLMPLVSPLGWDYTFLSSILALTIIGDHFYRFSVPARLALVVSGLVISVSLYDLLGRQAYARFMSFSVITLCFLVIAGLAAALRFKRIC